VKIEEVDDETLMYNPNILDSSRVLLFIITDETRSLAPMTLAAHYIGLGYNVVLCVQMLHDGCTIGNDKVSFAKVKKNRNINTCKRFFLGIEPTPLKISTPFNLILHL
jgi:hypothetical protein